MADIKDIHEGATVLGEFGIKVVGQVESSSDLPDPTEYEGEYGDAYVVGEEAPYDYYIFTRPFEDVDDPQWFNLGQFPAPGPQGETGETGATGATPAITATATTSTLSSGQDASVSITKTGTDEAPHFTFAFEIPQGVQGIQGVQGAQGIQGPQGPQGIQGQKGDTGYLYTIIGQVNNESSLPLPGQVGRTSAFLVGSQEPYDVYIIIGQDAYDLEWLDIGPIATVVPTTYIASESDASSGTLDATTLAAINNETNVHYMRVGSELYEFANKYNGNAYYMSLRYDSSVQMSKVARFTVALSSGAWTTGSDVVPLGSYTVTTNTTQTITGTKTFNSTINVGPAFQIGVSGTSPSEYYSLLRTGAYSEGIFFHTDGIAVGAKLYPGSNNTYDLGSSTNKWKDLWLSGYLRDGTNSILLSNLATLSGDQTFSGVISFDETIKAWGIKPIDGEAEVSISAGNASSGYGSIYITAGDANDAEGYIDISAPYWNGHGSGFHINDEGVNIDSAYTISLAAVNGIQLPDLMTSPDQYDDEIIWNNNGYLCIGSTGPSGSSPIIDNTVSCKIWYYDSNETQHFLQSNYIDVNILTAYDELNYLYPNGGEYLPVTGLACTGEFAINSNVISSFNSVAPSIIFLDISNSDISDGYSISNTIITIGPNKYKCVSNDQTDNLYELDGTFRSINMYSKINFEIIEGGLLTYINNS